MTLQKLNQINIDSDDSTSQNIIDINKINRDSDNSGDSNRNKIRSNKINSEGNSGKDSDSLSHYKIRASSFVSNIDAPQFEIGQVKLEISQRHYLFFV